MSFWSHLSGIFACTSYFVGKRRPELVSRKCRRHRFASVYEKLEDRRLMAIFHEMIEDIIVGMWNSNPEQITAANDEFYFVATDALHGTDLWKSDGTADGTAIVKDIVGAVPRNLTFVNGVLYFSTTDVTDRFRHRLWRSDGTPDGTTMVKDVEVRHFGPFFQWGDAFYFNGNDGINGTQLWKSDGTADGTMMVAKAGTVQQFLRGFGDSFYFRTGALWRSDGTEEGTILVTTAEVEYMVELNGSLYFDGQLGFFSFGLYKTDGTAAGTVLLKEFPQELDDLRVTNGRIVFHTGGGIWSSDGTPEGTQFVRNIRITFHGFPSYFVEFNRQVYFTANQNAEDAEIWKTDGTLGGTTLVARVREASGRTGPRPQVVGDRLFIRHDDRVHGIEPWFIDENDRLQIGGDLWPGVGTSSPEAFFDVGGNAVFAANGPEVGRELWRIVFRANNPGVSHAISQNSEQTKSGLVVSKNTADGNEVTHVKITNITHGSLFLNDGVTSVANGDFVSFSEAAKGFKFTPAAGLAAPPPSASKPPPATTTKDSAATS